MDWERFWNFSEKSFYTEIIAAVIGLLAIFIYFLKAKPRGLKYLMLLMIASETQMIAAQVHYLLPNNMVFGAPFYYNSLFAYLIIELPCCLLYLKSNIHSALFGKLIVVSILLFSAYTLTYYLFNFNEQYFPQHISVLEGFLIIIPCLYYFYELFIQKPDKELLWTPPFWVISGMLLLFSTISPVFIFFNYIKRISNALINNLYIINNVTYSLFFITIIIAIFLSPPKKLSPKI